MALTVKGGVLFNSDGTVFEGTLGVGDDGSISIEDISDAGAAGAAILALDDFGTDGQILATNSSTDDVEWVDDATA